MADRMNRPRQRGHDPVSWMKALLWLGWFAIGLNIWLITHP